MIASIGFVPVAAFASAAANGFGSVDAARLAEKAIAGDLRNLRGYLGDSAAVRPLFPIMSGPVEVVLGLEGRSLAAEQAFRTANGFAPLGPAEQRAYVARLRDLQSGLGGELEASGAHVLHQYQIVYNGIAVSADMATLQRIAQAPAFARVVPTAVYEIELAHSVPFILGGKTNAELGADGSGVTIAIIDSGIDYTHADFGGSGLVAAYTGNDRTIIEPGTFPTAKVIGGTDLVGEFYDARGTNSGTRASCTATPVPDPDPLDHNGHGSHVAGIAAGMGFGTFPKGVAPGASLYAIKLFSGCSTDGTASTSSANVVAALEVAVDPNGDGDTSDAVDVINMSLGSGFGRNTELTAVATNAAVDEGVIVVASAGNGGNIPYVTGAPAAATKAISVAAGGDPGFGIQLVNVAGSAGADANYQAIEAAFTPPLEVIGAREGVAVKLGEPTTTTGPVQLCSALPAGSLAGKIPLIQRGGCTFQVKIANAEAAGAIAAVVYNNVAGAPIVMGGTSAGIPAVMVSLANGITISAAIDSDTRFRLDPANFVPLPNVLQSFTSRGPRFNDAQIKPDVTAPGGSIFSVDVGSGTGGVSLSGTSMSSPHVAGAAALLRELHPNWSVKEIKSLLMNTATNAEPSAGVPYPVTLMGAGRVRVDVAANTESVVVPGSASFGVTERERTGVQTFTTQLEVRNHGSRSKTFALSSAFLFASDAEGSITFLHPASIRVGAGTEKTFEFSMRVNFNALAPSAQFEEYDGFLTLTETTGGGDVLRVPFHMIPIARANAAAADEAGDSFTITNRGIRPTLVDIYQFGVRDPNEDLIIEGPGMPREPDDWFDIRHTGAHTFLANVGPPLGVQQLIEFGVTTYHSRSSQSMMETDVFIDVNGGGPDFVAVTIDRGILQGIGFSGVMVSAIFPLSGPGGSIQFGVSRENNQAWQTTPILLKSLNDLPGPNLTPADPDFDYFVVTTDLETGAFDESGTASFNVFAPHTDADPNFLEVAPGETATIAVLGTGHEGLLVIYYENVGDERQSQRISVHAEDHDDGE